MRSNYLISLAERLFLTVSRLFISIYVGNKLGVEEMGKYAVVAATLHFSYLVAEAGIGSFLIKIQSDNYLPQITTLNFIFSALISCSATAFLFNQMNSIGLTLFGVVMVSIYVFLNSTNSIRSSLLIRDEKFSSLAKINITSTFIYALVTLLCIQFFEMGFEALLLGSIFSTFPLLFTVSLPKRWAYSFTDAKTILSYSSPLLLSNIANGAYLAIFAHIFPKKLNYGMLGIYNRSEQLSNTMTSVINTSFNRVNFPKLSKLNDKNRYLFEIEFYKTTRIVFIVILSAITISVVLIEPLVNVFFSKEWSQVISVFRYLAIISWSMVIYSHCLNLYKVNGDTRFFVFFESIRLLSLLFMLQFISIYGLLNYIFLVFIINIVLIFVILLHMRYKYYYKYLFSKLMLLFLSGLLFSIILLFIL